MIWTLKNLMESCNETQAEINKKWVPARPLNWRCRTLKQKLKEALAVFNGKAEAFMWPEGQ